MKRFFVLLLACLALFAFTACGKKDSEKKTDEIGTEETLKQDSDGAVEIGNQPLTLGIEVDPSGLDAEEPPVDSSSGGTDSGNTDAGKGASSSGNTTDSGSKGSANVSSSGNTDSGNTDSGKGGSGSTDVPLPPILGGNSSKEIETPLIPLK